MAQFTNKTRIRVIVVTVVSLAVILTILHLTLLLLVRNAIEGYMIDSVRGISTAVARTIEFNVDQYKEFSDSEEKDINSEFYIKMNNFLAELRDVGDLSYIYTINPTDEKDVYEFILCGETINSESWIRPGERDTQNVGRRGSLLKDVTRDGGFKVKSRDWGDFIISYVPFTSTDEEDNEVIVGWVGVAISSENYGSYVNRIQIVLFIVYALILFFVILLVRRLSGNMVESMLKDKLTGAYTKRHYDSIIQTGIKEALRTKQDLNLLILDLDHFKKVNDVYGHPFGDKVLSETSKVIIKSLRQGDYFIRYGGEEFIAVVKSSKGVNILEIAERIRVAVSKNTIYNQDLNNFHTITISIGISTYDRVKKCNVSTLVSRADKALYEAKKDRNKVCVYTPELETTE